MTNETKQMLLELTKKQIYDLTESLNTVVNGVGLLSSADEISKCCETIDKLKLRLDQLKSYLSS